MTILILCVCFFFQFYSFFLASFLQSCTGALVRVDSPTGLSGRLVLIESRQVLIFRIFVFFFFFHCKRFLLLFVQTILSPQRNIQLSFFVKMVILFGM